MFWQIRKLRNIKPFRKQIIERKAMSRNVNRGGLKLKLRGPAWKTKVGFNTEVGKRSIRYLVETKFWEIKVILN